MYLEQQIASILQILHTLDARMESMEQSLQRVVTDLTEVKVGLSPDVNLKQEFSEFKDRWDSGSPDVQNLKASLEKLKSSLGGLTGLLSVPVDVVATEVETEVVTTVSEHGVSVTGMKPGSMMEIRADGGLVIEAEQISVVNSPVQHIETTIKPAVKIIKVADQDESDAGIEMGKVVTNPLPTMWQGQTVGVKSRQEAPDDGLPTVRFAIGDKIVDRK